jgi:DNA-directed RNA polymerase subunit omega
MNKPSLDQLMKNMDSRYSLVVIAAKRARVLTEMAESDREMMPNREYYIKPVTQALQELVRDKVNYKRARQGIK